MAIELNRAALTYARALIRRGAVDRRSPWTFAAADGDALLGSGTPDWQTYGHVHLGADPSAGEQTKQRYHYPLAKKSGGAVKVYLSALRAIRTRAAQQNQRDIFDAAGRLLAEAKPSTAARAEIAACAFELKRGEAGSIQLTPAGTFRARDGRPKDAPAWRVDAAATRAAIAQTRPSSTMSIRRC